MIYSIPIRHYVIELSYGGRLLWHENNHALYCGNWKKNMTLLIPILVHRIHESLGYLPLPNKCGLLASSIATRTHAIPCSVLCGRTNFVPSGGIFLAHLTYQLQFDDIQFVKNQYYALKHTWRWHFWCLPNVSHIVSKKLSIWSTNAIHSFFVLSYRHFIAHTHSNDIQNKMQAAECTMHTLWIYNPSSVTLFHLRYFQCDKKMSRWIGL